MASQGITFLILAAFMAFMATTISARRSIDNMNVIDKCWRTDANWENNRHNLASCSVGYAGKMNKNMGHDVTYYEVTDSGDDALNPKLGTLRYGMTQVKGKVWVTFQKDMNITLQKPLLVRSFSVIDGRGASVHIAGGGCLLLHRVIFYYYLSYFN